MKIALLGENYYPTLGGVQEHIHHLALNLIAQGHDVRVITGMPSVDEWQGPRDQPWVIRVGRARRYPTMGTYATSTLGPGAALRLSRTLRDERFNLVHVHGPCDLGLPLLLYALWRGPIVATLHSPINDRSPLRRLAAPYYQWVLKRSNAIVAVSDAARIAMSRYARFDSDVVPNGVDVAALAAGRPMARFADGRTNILMLGRLEHRNGPDILFDALPEIVKHRPDVRLLVAGAGAKKNDIREHQERIPAALRDHVVFLGPVFQERPDVYASAKLCVVPARSGTFSIIVLEALAAGVPVVATPFIENHRSLPHFRPVTVAADFTPATLARTVLAALAEDPAGRVDDGRRIALTLDWKNVAGRIAGIYKQVLHEDARQGTGHTVQQSAVPR